MYLFRYLLLFTLITSFYTAYSQPDVDLHLNSTLLSGKNIMKVKRDFYDPYLWVLAQNNEVYRINSLTNEIVDYTSQFSAYNGLQFIDIAGRSSDTVFVATNSDKVIANYKGILSVIGSANGVAGTVNSIGLDFTQANSSNDTYVANSHLLLIATNHGLLRYDYANGSILTGSVNIDSKIFDASYRTEMHSHLEWYTPTDTVRHYPVLGYVLSGIYGGSLWLGGHVFGNNVTSAYYTTGQVGGNASSYMNLYWATEKGLFQNNRANSDYGPKLYNHYLDGIKINKITSIYGLLSFGDEYNSGLIKENMLVGTDHGLYYSNSAYNHFVASVNKFTLYNYAELGDKVINDICINNSTYSKVPQYGYPECEDGVWIAAADGLYLLKPDYAPYVNTTQQLQAIIFDNQGPAVTQIQLCANTTVKADILGYVYNGNVVQWYKDGQELPNEVNLNLTITQPGDYNAIIYDPCSAIHFESNHLKVTQIATPVVNFNYPDQISYCNGSTATLKTDDNALYQYRWYKNGILNGNTTATLTTTQSGKYKVEVSACSGSWVTSKEVQIDFINVPQPAISANKSAYCMGDQATLSINFTNDGTYTINWFLDGGLLNADQNKTSITTTQPGSYTASISSNLTSCSQLSAAYTLNFEAPPTVNIQQIINTTLCDGETVGLKASYSNGNIRWSTGETTDQIDVKQSGGYTATATTAAGCATTQNINVQFFTNPTLAVADASLCQFTNEVITLTAPSGFARYEWNGQPGTANFITGKLGQVNLTVTDNNGCKATQTINISSYCNDIHVPNTFTPNGDGINDTWTISGLEDDPSASIKVYSRLGHLIFETHGYTKFWDGTYKGKKLASGTYYYVISARQAKQILSGSISIIY